jgi:hypothetical protein
VGCSPYFEERENMAREFRTNNKSEDSLAKVFLNSEDDFIYINVKDATIFDRFAELLQWLEKKEADLREQEKNSKDYAVRDENGDIVDVDVDEFLRCSSLRTETCKEVVNRIDGIFGENTIRKYFHKFYEINPGFVPDDECIYDFLDEMTPILNELFSEREKRIELKYNRERKGGKRSRYRSREELIKEYMGK